MRAISTILWVGLWGICLCRLSYIQAQNLDNTPNKSQTYTVLAQRGKIIHLKKEEELYPGMRLSSKQKVEFIGLDSEACLIDDKGQRYHLWGRYLPDSTNLGLVGETLGFYPNRQIRCCMSDGEGIPKLRHFLISAHPKIMVLGDTLQLQVKSFELNHLKYFFVRYPYQGKQINRKLDHRHDTLSLIQETIFLSNFKDMEDTLTINPAAVDTIALFYKRGTQNYEQIKRFQISFVDPLALKPSFEALQKHYAQMEAPPPKLKFEYFDFFGEVYGFTDLYKLEVWLKQEGFLE